MDIQNHFYGHSAALAAHAGLASPRHLAGLIQHGWTPNSPVLSHFADLAATAPEGNLFVWSHSSRAWDPQESRASTGYVTTPIGSPFLYLADLVAAHEGLPERTIPVVVLPFHGTRLIEVQGDQAVYAREVFEREGPAVVCLHVDDLQRPEVLRAWTDAGHTVTTAGERNDPAFISRILWLVASARRVVSNRLATAILYAAAVGTETEVYGPWFEVKGAAATSPEEEMRALWPEFFDASTPQSVLKELADQELGRPYLREPAELRQLLGWQTRSVRPAFDYWAGAPLQKALGVLGLRQGGVAEEDRTESIQASPLAFLKHPLEHLPSPLPRTSVSTLQAPEILDGNQLLAAQESHASSPSA